MAKAGTSKPILLRLLRYRPKFCYPMGYGFLILKSLISLVYGFQNSCNTSCHQWVKATVTFVATQKPSIAALAVDKSRAVSLVSNLTRGGLLAPARDPSLISSLFPSSTNKTCWAIIGFWSKLRDLCTEKRYVLNFWNENFRSGRRYNYVYYRIKLVHDFDTDLLNLIFRTVAIINFPR